MEITHDQPPLVLDPIGVGPLVTVIFPLQGGKLPADHGYALYSAIARAIPAAHGADGPPGFGLELISGVPWDRGLIALPRRGAVLRLRVPASRFPHLLPLAGKSLDILGHRIRLGVPSARPLTPAASLYARCVTIKKFTEAEDLLDAARRQLEALGIDARLELPVDDQGRFRRRIVTIHGKKVVGFSLAAHGLNDEDSIRLQTLGLGGRRAMGCGLFNPIVKKLDRGN